MNDFEKALEKKIDRTKGSGDPVTEKFGYIIGRWAREWLLENNNPKVYESGWNSCLEHFQLEKLHTENQGLKAELKDCNDDQDWALNRIEKLRTSNKRLRELLHKQNKEMNVKYRSEAEQVSSADLEQALETEGDGYHGHKYSCPAPAYKCACGIGGE